MRVMFLIVVLLVMPAPAFAQECGSPGNVRFAAETERGFPYPPQTPRGIITKLKREQCGFVALWVPAALVNAPETKNCKFGQTMDVTGSQTEPVPAGGPFSGNMLVVKTMKCPK